MANNDAELRIGGNIDDLKAATDKATAEVKNMAAQMQSSLSSVNGVFQRINSQFLALTAAIAGGTAFKSVINASNDWALESGKLGKALGTTTEQASVMKVAMTHLGIESDTMVMASQKMSKQIFSNGQAFEKLGVQVKDSSGQYRPVVDVMGDVNKKLVEIKNPIEQNIAGMQVYGKGWAEVKGILKLTADQMQWAEQRAKDLHLIVGPEGEAQAKQYKAQMRDLNLVGKSLEVQFGQQLTPVFVKLGSWMGEEAPAMGNVFRTVLESIAFAAQSTWLALKDMGDGLGALAAQAAALLHGDLEGFRAIGRARDEEAAKNEAAYERMKANFGKDVQARSKAPETGGPTYDFGKDGKDPADKSRMAAWEAQLSEAKVFYQKQYELKEYSKAQELEYWQSILRNVNVSGQERLAITQKVSGLELEIMKKKLQQQKDLAAEEINAHEKAADDALKLEEMQSQREYDLGAINKQELLALQQQYEDRRFAIAQEAQAARITAMLGDPNMDPVALQKLLDQMAEIQRAHVQKVTKIEADMAVESKTRWEQALSPISSAFEKSITGMIQGTQTWRKAMSSIFTSILGEFISLGVKMATQWAAMELAKTAATQKGTVLRSVLEKMGLIETTATQVTSSTATAAAKKTEAAATIPAEAAEAAGGAASAVAGIPIVGPALAAAAYAETMAMVMGGMATASAAGGFDIPAGVNPVTQLHQQEMVLPAQYANVIRGMAGEGGTGGGTNITIHAMDARSVRDYFKANSHVLAPALRNLARNSTPVKA